MTHTLTVLRYEQYMKKIATIKTEFDIALLPPTENAAKYHLLRVQLKCIFWKTLDSVPDPTLWEWKKVNAELQPYMTDMSPAPDILLHSINFACKTTVDEPCRNMKCILVNVIWTPLHDALQELWR